MITLRELRYYLRLALRWWWVFILATALAAGTAYAVTSTQPDLYVAKVAVLVGQGVNTTRPDPVLLSTSGELARAYGELAKREPILDPVVKTLQLPFSWELLRDRMLGVQVVEGANLVELSVMDTSPERAAAIANAVAEGLIAYSPNSPEEARAFQATVQTQIDELQAEIEKVSAEISALEERRARATSAGDIADLNERLQAQRAVRDDYQSRYTQLIDFLSSSNANSLSIFEPARIPDVALPSKQNLIIAIAAIAALLIAGASILLLDFLDDRWFGSVDLRDQLGINFLGRLPVGAPLFERGDNLRERERALREAQTNILLVETRNNLRSLLISSPHANQARSAFAVDLATLFARSGYRVVLVDADVTAAHASELLNLTAQSETEPRENGAWAELFDTAIPGVRMLGSRRGAEEGDPVLLPQQRWKQIIKDLGRNSDLLIFDGPAVLDGVDAVLLAPLVDAVVLAVSPKQDSRSILQETRNRLHKQANTQLLGAVIVGEDRARGGRPRGRRSSNPVTPAATPAQPPAIAEPASSLSSERRPEQEIAS